MPRSKNLFSLMFSCILVAGCIDRSLSDSNLTGESDPRDAPGTPGGGGKIDAGKAAPADAGIPVGKPDAAVAPPDARAATPDAYVCTPMAEQQGSCVCTSETCEPGMTRWCDGPVYCDWGLETCGPDGQWGACVETRMHPGDCEPAAYSVGCCVAAGGCCAGNDGWSVGTCPGVTETCHPVHHHGG